MGSVPRRSQIRRSLKATVRELKQCLKEVNQRAAKLMARGDYVRAQAIMEQAKQVSQFVAELRGFQQRLAELGRGPAASASTRPETHPQWEYYRPILTCLAHINGDASRERVEQEFAERFDAWLLPGDRALTARGEPHWRAMIRRSKKHLVSEALIEAPNHLRWRITAAGRKAAQSDTVSGPAGPAS